MTSIEMLSSYRLAPLKARRDMAMVGVIQRCVSGKGPHQIRKVFVPDAASTHPTGRSTLRRHTKQLRTYRNGHFLESTAKSIFGLIDVYNMLPQEMVDTECVHKFQGQLQGLLKDHAETDVNWETLFSPRHALHLHPLARRLSMVDTTSARHILTESMPCPNLDCDEGGVFQMDDNPDLPPSWW